MPLAILALAVGAFAIGTTEFVAMGLLPQMADTFGVSIATAGWLITAYALGVVVGAPTLTALTHSWPRKRVLTGLMALFVVGHAATALAPTFGALVGARFLSGLGHGAFFGASALVARKIAPPGRQGQAMALVFTGLTVANVVGVPAGTYVGQQLGWRLTFALVGLIGVATIAAILAIVPEVETRAGSLRSEFAAFRRSQVWWTLLIVTVGFASMFTVLSYVSPLLTEVAGFSEGAVSWVLVLFGVGATLGNVLGGRLADWRPYRTLAVGFAAQAVVFTGLFLFAGNRVAAAVGVFLFAFVAFTMSAPIQTRGITAAGGGASMASAAMQAAFNIGNAMGAFLGGIVIDGGFGYAATAVVALVLALLGLAILAEATRVDKNGRAPLDPRVAAVPAQRRRRVRGTVGA
ncbi:MFS transporter [Kineococcus radiotolerans]|uniref:Major facilitator superfamily MFS_1 n=1 Tax=Kineococcus radiotolerans (strain ATCC BAA-149 / DSM 14245 / SRS30216) TaxID=266940 RepID=A6W552_KINRD|nr:MFS transporter [Kineococcus radiotolerans]ABS01941.1 major facilitator superfamily MFS_1 [Kineococcus radiotolerans SRS30216 = ATCC BAA-149]